MAGTLFGKPKGEEKQPVVDGKQAKVAQTFAKMRKAKRRKGTK